MNAFFRELLLRTLQFTKNKIKKLKEENKMLKNQLLEIKLRLNTLIKNIETYDN